MEETAHKFAIHLIVLVHNFMEDLLVLNVRKFLNLYKLLFELGVYE